MTSPAWRCPLCGALADEARAHLTAVHGLGSGPDRFGLRDAARTPDPGARRSPDPAPGSDPTPISDDAEDHDTPGLPPPVWRQVPRTPPRRSPNGSGRAAEPPPDVGFLRRAPRRPIRSSRAPGDIADVPPPRRAPLPPDAAVMRLIAGTLDGVDAAALQARLLDLPGVTSVTLDLYARTIDLYIDRERAVPPHLIALVTGRLRLPVHGAEIHRAPPRGEPLGDATRLYVVQ